MASSYTMEKFRLDIRKNFLTKQVVKHWNKLEVLKKQLDMALSECYGLVGMVMISQRTG